MQHLIVLAHPNPKSFSAAIATRIHQLSQDLGNAVFVRDLYKARFNPVLSADDFISLQKGVTPKDIRAEQALIEAADLVTLIFPLWWTGYPAIMKGWIDRVLLHGFAFKFDQKTGAVPLLTGKKIQIITTMGASVNEYEANGLMDAMAMTMGDNVWSYCGFDDAGMIVLGDIPGMSDKERMSIMTEIEDTLVLAMATDARVAKPAKKSPAKKAPAKKAPAKKSPAKPKKKPASKKK